MAKIKEAIEEFRPDPKLVDERGPTRQRLKRTGGDVHVDLGRIYVRDSPIERALTRKVITGAQYTAAGKFYNHWYRAGLSENFGSADLNRVFGGDGGFAGMAKTENQAFHRQRYRQAVQVIGPLGSQVLTWIICDEKTIEDTGVHLLGWKDEKQARAAATTLLRDRLDSLCKEWGIGP